MVTFTEEILNGKLHFLCSVMSVLLRKISLKKGFLWPAFSLVRTILSLYGKVRARENPDYGIFHAAFAETSTVQCFRNLRIDLITCRSVKSFRLYTKIDKNKIHKKIVITSRIFPWDSQLQSSIKKMKLWAR